MLSEKAHRRYLLVLVLVYLIYWGVLAIDPVNRHDWLLENLLVLLLAMALLAGHRYYLPSPAAATLIFLYLCLHQLGAHYTYAKVPYDAWWQALTGQTLSAVTGWERNHFDRMVHLSYGLLLAYPLREVLRRLGVPAGFWSYLLPVEVVLSTSAIYELIEWFGAEVLGGKLGRTLLGAQNDPWDAQKDMALGAAGALFAMLCTVLLQAHARRRPGHQPERLASRARP